MKGILALPWIGAAGLAGAALAQNGIPVAPHAGPPVSSTGFVVDFEVGQVSCDGGVAVPVRVERPFPVWAEGMPGSRTQPIEMAFRIDAEGRPLSIVRQQRPSAAVRVLYISSEDVLPAFAAWRFAAGQARTGCRMRFDPVAAPIATASPTLLRRYYVSPHQRRPQERQLFARLHPADTNCIEAGVPQVRLRAYPAFEDIPQPSGTWSYSMTGFDIDASGKPVRVQLTESNGNAVLDREALAAIRRSRFAPEARHGCTYPYYRYSTTAMTGPAMPPKASFKAADARCPDETIDWAFLPPLRFPQGFERRRIEGWAIVGYDVAPWGVTGNVRVLAAEPAAAFGEQAQRVIQQARQPASSTGASGCVDVVRFVIAEGRGPINEG
ncbi:TonB family protein [Sphingomonas xinjiangensis]|uniref:TonB family protein n=1 Tax=Sphingomonas xinjiangensis TaxID=643568 RepID=A0A840YE15_9SPHN|nr:TonB family protein [Sphingomonas xinjiangensis]MBB5709028.1 TonB family protein [Sphingomonas xinjiangensis]